MSSLYLYKIFNFRNIIAPNANTIVSGGFPPLQIKLKGVRTMNDYDALETILKSTEMGMKGISTVMPMVKSPKLRSELKRQYERYSYHACKSAAQIRSMNRNIKHVGTMSDMALKINAHMKGNNDSKIAEMTINGSSMGTVKLNRILNNSANTSPAVIHQVKGLLDVEQTALEKLKSYL